MVTVTAPITGNEPVTLPGSGSHVMRFRVDVESLRPEHRSVVTDWLRGAGIDPGVTRAIALFDTEQRYLLHASCLRQVDGGPVIDWAANQIATEPIVVAVEDWPDELNAYAPERYTWMTPATLHVPVTERAA